MVEDVAVLIPAYQPDESLVALVEELRAYFVHVVVVDDGSTVGAEAFASVRPRVDALLAHERNRGKGAVIRHAAEALAAEGVDVMIVMDADGQHDPEDLPRFIEAAERDPGGGRAGEADPRDAGPDRRGVRDREDPGADLRPLRRRLEI